MMRFNMADRDRNKVRGSINWDATAQLSLQGNVEYTDDNYSNSVYGLQNAKNFMANVEGNFAVNENFNANLFYTYEEQRAQSAGLSYSAGAITNTATVGGVAGNTVVSGGCFSTVLDKNANAKIDPCLNWSTDMKDKVNTIGGGFTWKGLMGGKLDLIGNLLYSDARTDIGITGGTYANNPYGGRRQARRDSRRHLHPDREHADGQPEDDRAADRRPVCARQAVRHPRVLRLAAPEGERLCVRRPAVRDDHERHADQRAGAELQRLRGRRFLYLPLALKVAGVEMGVRS